MPKLYRKRAGKRRYGRRRFKRRNSKRFKRGVKQVLNQMAEHKFYGSNIAASVTNAGSLYYLNGNQPVIGTSSITRIGSDIRMRSIKLKCWVSGLGIPNIDYIRVIVGCWKDYQVSAPTAGLLLDSTSRAELSFYNRPTIESRRWIPMYDKTFYLSNAQTYTADAPKLWIPFRMSFHGKKLPMKRVNYNANGDADHAYFVFLISGSVAGQAPVFHADWRFTYVDY